MFEDSPAVGLVALEDVPTVTAASLRPPWG